MRTDVLRLEQTQSKQTLRNGRIKLTLSFLTKPHHLTETEFSSSLVNGVRTKRLIITVTTTTRPSTMNSHIQGLLTRNQQMALSIKNYWFPKIYCLNFIHQTNGWNPTLILLPSPKTLHSILDIFELGMYWSKKDCLKYSTSMPSLVEKASWVRLEHDSFMILIVLGFKPPYYLQVYNDFTQLPSDILEAGKLK